jgi:Glycine-zipper domain
MSRARGLDIVSRELITRRRAMAADLFCRTAKPFVLAGALLVATTLTGTQVRAQGPFIYANNGQSQEQQNRDRLECHDWSVSQTGFDPTRPPPPAPGAPPPTASPARGALGGAAVGAIGGAIGGNAGAGAAIGAGTGALIGGARRRQQARQAQDVQAQQASAFAAQTNTFNKALATCLQARGYTVNF